MSDSGISEIKDTDQISILRLFIQLHSIKNSIMTLTNINM